jgi:2-polyprenyl-3-methyl-5-hydroxy-6-metoxy-1,4-benzoquinol methylase
MINRQLDRVGLHVSKRSTFCNLLTLRTEVEHLRSREVELTAKLARREEAYREQLSRLREDNYCLREEVHRLRTPAPEVLAGLPSASTGSQSPALYAEPRLVTRLEECYFYHTLDLPEIGVVHGCWDLRDKFYPYVGDIELAGKTVLDIGTASGFLTFEAERRGAQVVSYDLLDASNLTPVPFKDKLAYTDRQAWVRDHTTVYERMKNSYWLAHRLYQSKARVHYGNLYHLPESLGKFDVVFVGSVLEHLNDPVGALASITKVAGNLLIINTPYLDTEEKTAQFLPSADHPENDYTWWYYSLGTYKELFAMLGFRLQKISWDTYLRSDQSIRQPRATIVAERIPSGN